jgi:isoleucyl-tRNA synthetase
LTHGFVVDGEGKKMSKSLGNVITPEQVMKKYGADILRLWVASSDYSEDIRLSDEILTRLADAYRKIRNTYKYLLSNLYDFDPDTDKVPHQKMLEADRWILSRLSVLIKDSAKNYDSFSFHKVYRDLYGFCVYEVSSVYLDILKDRMYTFKSDSLERRSGQTAMFELLSAILRIAAPLLAMTTDEAWGYLRVAKKPESVHLADWPEDHHDKWFDEALNNKWGRLIQIREEVAKSLEEVRSRGDIGSGLEARVTVFPANDADRKLLEENKDALRYLFIVSQADVSAQPGQQGGAIGIKVEKAKGAKCQRCWNYSEFVGKDKDHPALCERCVKAV